MVVKLSEIMIKSVYQFSFMKILKPRKGNVQDIWFCNTFFYYLHFRQTFSRGKTNKNEIICFDCPLVIPLAPIYVRKTDLALKQKY